MNVGFRIEQARLPLYWIPTQQSCKLDYEHSFFFISPSSVEVRKSAGGKNGRGFSPPDFTRPFFHSRYPVKSVVCFVNTCPLDSDLTDG